MTLSERISYSVEFIRQRCHGRSSFGIISGTGLGDIESLLSERVKIAYSDIPYFPNNKVGGGGGSLIFGMLDGIPVWLMSGRFHYYEGFSTAETTYPIRVLKALGIKELVLTNAAGAVNPHFAEGDIVMITDHINLLPDHPMRGHNEDILGLRFPDMSEAYSPVAPEMIREIAAYSNIDVKEGVYLALQGPSLETPAEYRMIHRLGADMVGMSTVPEVIVARHSGLEVLAFSVISNVCFPKSRLTATTIESVIDTVQNAAPKLAQLIIHYIKKKTAKSL